MLARFGSVVLLAILAGGGCDGRSNTSQRGAVAGSAGMGTAGVAPEGGERGVASEAGGGGASPSGSSRAGEDAGSTSGGAHTEPPDTGGEASVADGGAKSGSSGSAGDGGAAGLAGSGGSDAGCNSNRPFSCDDDNTCTRDFVDLMSCSCAYEALPNDSVCDDGDVCTEGDRCATGACAGTARVSAAEILGEARSFGNQLGLATLVAFVADDRLVFAEDGTLSLVGIDGDRLEVLDRVEMGLTVVRDYVSAILGVLRPRTFLVTLRGERLAVATKNQGIEVYSIQDDRLTLVSRYPLQRGTEQAAFNVAAGTGASLWTCFGSSLRAYTVDDLTAEVTPGESLGLPGGHSCQGAALTPSGETLLVATSDGLDRVDVSNPDGTMTLLDQSHGGRFLLDVAASENHVLTYEIQDNVSGLGDLLVLNAATLEVEEVVPRDPVGATPVGFALTAGGLVLQQWSDGDGAVYTGEYYELAPNVRELRSRWSFIRTVESPSTFFPVHTVARGEYAVLEPTHQVVRFEDGGRTVTPVGGPNQGSFERVRAVDENRVNVHSRISTHAVDLSDPSRPRVEAGGLMSPLEAEFLRVDVSSPSSAAFLSVPTPITQANAGGAITLVRDDPFGAPLPVSTVEVEDVGDNQWIDAGEYLYQLTARGSLELQIRRFLASSLGADGPWLPNFEQVVTPPAPNDTAARVNGLGIVPVLKFAVDSATGTLFALDRRTNGELFSGFSLGADGYEPAFSRLEPNAVGIAAARGRVLVLHTERAQLVAETGETLAALPLESVGTARSILGFDGRRAYLDVRFTGDAPGPGVLVLSAEDLSEIARYATPDPVLSSAEVGAHLAFGTGSRLIVAAPACAAE
jgi:hypothetical protein